MRKSADIKPSHSESLPHSKLTNHEGKLRSFMGKGLLHSSWGKGFRINLKGCNTFIFLNLYLRVKWNRVFTYYTRASFCILVNVKSLVYSWSQTTITGSILKLLFPQLVILPIKINYNRIMASISRLKCLSLWHDPTYGILIR